MIGSFDTEAITTLLLTLKVLRGQDRLISKGGKETSIPSGYCTKPAQLIYQRLCHLIGLTPDVPTNIREIEEAEKSADEILNALGATISQT